MADAEQHLGLIVGFVPQGCDPVGLGGDGRGSMVGAAWECPQAVTLRIERFDAESNDDEVPGTPSETSAGRVEWRDGPSGDVIRVVSEELDVDVLLQVADSIEVRGG